MLWHNSVYFVNLQGSDFDWGHLTPHPPRIDVLVTHSKHTMPHACSFRGYCYEHIPFVLTEYPHVPRTYVVGHPESHYLKSGQRAGGPFTTDRGLQLKFTDAG